jgi:hypothetical protein
MSTQAVQPTNGSGRKRPLPETTDYVGKGRVAACCARRRYNLRPDADEMNELMNHAASVYWHYLEVQQAHPAKAFVAARDRSATYYFRQMRGGKLAYLKEVQIVNLEDPIFGEDDDVTYLDRLSAAARTSLAPWREATDLQRLDWLGHEDLVTALVEGRKAAGITQRAITYARNLGTIHNEATIIRLAAHTSLAPVAGPHQREHRHAPGHDGGHHPQPPPADPPLAKRTRRAEGRGRPGRGLGQVGR